MFHKVPFIPEAAEAASPFTKTQQPQISKTADFPQQSRPSRPSQHFIMVIDDSLTACKIIETCLRCENFAVKSFPDGVDAMRWLTTPQARILDLASHDLA